MPWRKSISVVSETNRCRTNNERGKYRKYYIFQHIISKSSYLTLKSGMNFCRQNNRIRYICFSDPE